MVLIRAHRRTLFAGTVVAAAAALAVATQVGASSASPALPGASGTTTPIKHLVVIFQENVSFDHYFATYPNAANTDGTPFHGAPDTPKANTLATAHLLDKNPNLYPPSRLSPAQALTCDQNHSYGPEQKAANGGKNDMYVQNTSVDTCSGGLYATPGLTMDYYDGNTVTGIWNYAQQYAMSDNSYDTVFGPSTPGAVNLISGQTHGGQAVNSVTGNPAPPTGVVVSPDANGIGTVIGDPDPAFDDCSDSNHTSTNNLLKMSGPNIGDLLNKQGTTWGWFQGGFRPTTAYAGPGTYAVCGARHNNIGGSSVVDYSPHHSPFEYYQSTSNPHHLPPSSVDAIGHTDQANHNYDLSDFSAALSAGDLPAVSFLKAAEYQDGHAAYSDPIDEQHFLVSTINALEQSPDWSSTAVVVLYDDSDGWYDHQSAPLLNGSTDPVQDAAACTAAASTAGVAGGYLDRCGPGPRQPLLVISPYAKTNHIDHTMTVQASVTKFIEDNWQTGRVGDNSFDEGAGSLGGLFNFNHLTDKVVLLNQDGSIASITRN